MNLERLALALLAAAWLGCASTPGTEPKPHNLAVLGLDEHHASTTSDTYEVIQYVNDPIEPVNRASFSLTRATTNWVLRPLALGWRTILPRPLRTGIDNFGYNLTYPGRLVALLLQGQGKRAGVETAHFLVNTTAGVAGFVDVSSRIGIPSHREDVGQAFGRWGLGPGFYLFIPLVGPSSGRDGVGRVFDAALSPATWVPGATLLFSINALSSRLDTIDVLSDSTIDLYPPVRSLWAIQRDVEVSDYRIPESAWADADPNPSLGVLETRLADPHFPSRGERRELAVRDDAAELPYSLWLQEQPAPLLFLVPGIGAHRTATSVVQLAENAHARGYSVAIVSSPFHPEFILAGLSAVYPGYTPSDAADLYRVFTAIRRDVESERPGAVTELLLAGYSLGAIEALFVAGLDREAPEGERLGFARVVAINPPATLEHAATEFDRFFRTPATWPAPTRDGRVIDVVKRAYLVVHGEEAEEIAKRQTLPFDRGESDFLIGVSSRGVTVQALAASRRRGGEMLEPSRDSARDRRAGGPISDTLEAATLERYLEELAAPYFQATVGDGESGAELLERAGLRGQEAALRADPRIRVLTNRDDFILADGDVEWLESVLGERVTVFPRGGHLGNLHTSAFQTAVMDALEPEPPAQASAEPGRRGGDVR